MRILIATDAWRPQVNGVVSTLERMTQAAAAEFEAEFEFLTPQGMWTAPMPTYPDIRVAVTTPWEINRRIEEVAPDHVHIATEGPIGWLTRGYCMKAGRPFTTSYHTRFPEYIAARTGLPERLTYAGLRHFHAPSAAVMAPTPTICTDLTQRGFDRVRLWSRGVNHALFRPRAERTLDLPGPIFLCVGRVAVERTSKRCLASTFRVRPSLSATVRRARRSSVATRTPISSAKGTARRWRRFTPARTCSFFPRAPTRSASC